MKFKAIAKNDNLQEIFSYSDSSFPLGVWTDVYSLMIDKSLDCHWHSDFEFGVMISGELDYYIGEQYVHLKKGDCIFINSNSLHRATQCPAKEDAIMFVVTFQSSILVANQNSSLYAKLFNDILNSKTQGCVINGSSEHGREIINGLKEIYDLYDSDCDYELLCLSALCNVWYHTIKYLNEGYTETIQRRINSKHENEIREIVSYIQLHYTENIKIDDIAKHAKISRSELFRCFKLFTTKSPTGYINELRLSSAATMLKETHYDVMNICLKCGFSDPSYFGKLFKEKYGMTPLNYRKHFQ